MKFYLILLLYFFQACSFDNKTGIWNNVNEISKDKNGILGRLEFLLLQISLLTKQYPFLEN